MGSSTETSPTFAAQDDTTWCLPNGNDFFFGPLTFSFYLTRLQTIDVFSQTYEADLDATVEEFVPAQSAKSTLARHAYTAPSHAYSQPAANSAKAAEPVFVQPEGRPFAGNRQPSFTFHNDAGTLDPTYLELPGTRSHRSSISSSSSSSGSVTARSSASSVDSDTAFFRQYNQIMHPQFYQSNNKKSVHHQHHHVKDHKIHHVQDKNVEHEISSTISQIDQLLDRLSILRGEHPSHGHQRQSVDPLTVMMVSDAASSHTKNDLKRKTKRRSYQHSFETPDRIKEAKQQSSSSHDDHHKEQEEEEVVLDEHHIATKPSPQKVKAAPKPKAAKPEKKTMKATGFGYAGRGAAPGGSWHCMHCNTDTTPMVLFLLSVSIEMSKLKCGD